MGIRDRGRSRFVQQLMPDEQRNAQRSSRIACSRLDPDVVERPLAQNPPVADAIQGHAAGQAQFFQPGDPVRVPRHAQHDFFRYFLHRRGDVHVPLCQQRIRATRWATEQGMEPVRRHGQSLTVIEVGHVHAK